MRKKNRNSLKVTFTKKWLEILLIAAVVDMQLPFILAFVGRTELAESLAIAIVTEIVALFVPYLCKSFFETKEEKKNELERLRIENSIDVEEEAE